MQLRKNWFHLQLWFCELITNSIISSYLVPRPLRVPLLRLAGVRIAADVAICAGFTLHGRSVLTVGSGTFINYGCFVDLNAQVTIGTGVSIGYRTQIITATHQIGSHEARAGIDRSAEITIGDGVWIGAGAIVLPGVRIGDGCVIAAGSVVTGDCRPNTLYAGSPAVRKRDLIV